MYKRQVQKRLDDAPLGLGRVLEFIQHPMVIAAVHAEMCIRDRGKPDVEMGVTTVGFVAPDSQNIVMPGLDEDVSRRRAPTERCV